MKVIEFFIEKSNFSPFINFINYTITHIINNKYVKTS